MKQLISAFLLPIMVLVSFNTYAQNNMDTKRQFFLQFLEKDSLSKYMAYDNLLLDSENSNKLAILLEVKLSYYGWKDSLLKQLNQEYHENFLNVLWGMAMFCWDIEDSSNLSISIRFIDKTADYNYKKGEIVENLYQEQGDFDLDPIPIKDIHISSISVIDANKNLNINKIKDRIGSEITQHIKTYPTGIVRKWFSDGLDIQYLKTGTNKLVIKASGFYDKETGLWEKLELTLIFSQKEDNLNIHYRSILKTTDGIFYPNVDYAPNTESEERIDEVLKEIIIGCITN